MSEVPLYGTPKGDSKGRGHSISTPSGTNRHSQTLKICGGAVFKAHRLVYYSTLGLRVIKKKLQKSLGGEVTSRVDHAP